MADQLLSVTAVVVTYGDRYELCAETVRRALVAGARDVVVVANGLSPRVLSAFASLVEDRHEVSLLRSVENVGSAGGFHLGIAEALAHGSDWIWLLDDDNWADPSALAHLVHSHRETDLSPAKVARLATRLDSGGGRLVRSPPVGAFLYFDFWQRAVALISRQEADQYDLPYAPYGGLLLSKEAVATIGLPDPALVLYEDDTEYTARLRAHKFSIVRVPAAVIRDADGKWSKGGRRSRMVTAADSTRQFYSIRNRVSFETSALASFPQRLRFIMNLTVFTAISLILDLPRLRVHSLATYVRAVCDGARHRTGLDGRYDRLSSGVALSELSVLP